MTVLADLITARENLASELATESASPRPNYSVGGRSVPWSQYRAELIDQLERLRAEIIKERGAVELQTQAFG